MQIPPLLLLGSAVVLASTLVRVQAQSIFINELHYDNTSNDQNEGVEIAGPAGTDLGAYKLVFYNGANASTYGELPLSGSIPFQNGSAFGTKFFPRSGIQNGAPDGIALIENAANSVVQFLSYEGSFEALDGDAAGETSSDIGVSESGSVSPDHSLQLTGSGAVYSDFSWQAPAPASPGMINSGQDFLGAGVPTITLTFLQPTLSEGSSTTATVSVSPSPASPIDISIHNPEPGELSSPTTVSVPATGRTTFTVTAIDDSSNDGNQSVELGASAPLYEPATAQLRIIDIQRPIRGTAIRLATINTLNGVGARNSPEYSALLTLIERLDPDLIAFQEVSSAGGFFDLRALLTDLGIPHLATTDDGFLGQTYEGGRFNSDQNLAIASRYPITSTSQIDRGRDERKELTRYPLMVEIDVPGIDHNPIVVAVHYKASSGDASRYRRAIEAYRTLEAISAAGHDGASDNLFVLGDFNEDQDRRMPNFYNTGITNFNDGTTLPVTYRLGSDISGDNSITLPYAQFPNRQFGDAGFIAPAHRQQDGQASRTFIPLGDAALDYIFHSQRVADNGNASSEIYNSRLDHAFDGLVKQPPSAPPGTSFTASDHFAIIGDYELDPNPGLVLNISPGSLPEDAGPAAATGTLTLPAPRASPVTIELSRARPESPISLPLRSLTIEPGETQRTFPIDILYRHRADPDRTVTITASADNYSSATAILKIYNLQVNGRILLSQYTEAPSGSSPRGIELFNCGTGDIDLRAEPIHVIQYTNGSSNGNIVAIAEAGTLPAGGVVVIGDAIVGAYLEEQGFLSMAQPPIGAAVDGTHYLNPAGDLIYVKDFLPYTGDDALEIQFAYGLSDVFGTIGQDPGSAWESNGISTSGRNLSLLDDLATASTGFTEPHRRFKNTAAGTDLGGFGVAPIADDPFKHWLQSFGLSDPNDDPDCDGLISFLEFATGSDPTLSASRHALAIGSDTVSHRQRSALGRLNYSIEISKDLKTWRPANLAQLDQTANGDGTDTLTFVLPPGIRCSLRLRVIFE